MLGLLIGALALYVLAGAGLTLAMARGPAAFGAVMTWVPLAALRIFPFQTMQKWTCDGSLRRGDVAPDFVLPREDGKGMVRLSDFRGRRPVLLVFGSYT
jgi:hypothetical protein